MVPISWYLALSAVLFTIGVVGVLIQRNVIAKAILQLPGT